MAQKLGRRDRLIQQYRHDTYQKKEKYSGPTICKECDAVFIEGRWVWKEHTINANRIICPACRRIQEKYPAGHLEIKGSFFEAHYDELMKLIHNTERKEKNDHPMERIIAIKTEKGHSLVTTTGIHLARRIGEALKHSYQGELDFTYGDAEKSIHMTWIRG